MDRANCLGHLLSAALLAALHPQPGNSLDISRCWRATQGLGACGQRMRCIAANNGEHVVLERLRVERRPRLLDMVAERCHQSGCLTHRPCGGRVKRLAKVRNQLKGNAKRPRRDRYALKECAFDMRRRIGVTRLRSMGDIEKSRAVAHATGNDMLH